MRSVYDIIGRKGIYHRWHGYSVSGMC
ncbi:hypothetical protein OESDEN_19331 [Oesophagostomum dentatum]|uniref:Uncharacterized protein n=1 Tax=Oesophagostomum dentatum TaxID=61180 RepID=A0A0B1SBR1_OESDE|nr:hypothetical protein OESDEN_19331 [Oesophagostomum dentatum]